MKKETNVFEMVVALVTAVSTAILLSCFRVVIILDVIRWYGLPLSLSFKQIFGALLIISTAKYTYNLKKAETKKETWDFLSENIGLALLLSIFWGLAYFCTYFIK